jgi:transcriptional regulator with XRE-family HTH domain
LKEKDYYFYINGSNLKKFRERENITQDELASSLAVTRQTINSWEAKNSAKLDEKKLGKLIQVLKVSKEDLYDRKPTGESSEIPFYDTVLFNEASLLAEEGVDYPGSVEMIDPGTWFRGANGALRVYGHSMFPKYPAGCIIAYKIADKEVIIWGEDYVIELEDRRIVKRLDKSEVKGYVLAISYNKSEDFTYSPIELPIHKIKKLYMVLGKIEMEVSI